MMILAIFSHLDKMMLRTVVLLSNASNPSPQDIEELAVALCMIGKFAIAIAFGLIYLYTCELYPTIIR